VNGKSVCLVGVNGDEKGNFKLKGWNEMSEFLGQTVSVAQRWQHEGMPVTREGRSVYASPEELAAWVGTEHGKKEPVHIASERS